MGGFQSTNKRARDKVADFTTQSDANLPEYVPYPSTSPLTHCGFWAYIIIYFETCVAADSSHKASLDCELSDSRSDITLYRGVVIALAALLSLFGTITYFLCSSFQFFTVHPFTNSIIGSLFSSNLVTFNYHVFWFLFISIIWLCAYVIWIFCNHASVKATAVLHKVNLNYKSGVIKHYKATIAAIIYDHMRISDAIYADRDSTLESSSGVASASVSSFFLAKLWMAAIVVRCIVQMWTSKVNISTICEVVKSVCYAQAHYLQISKDANDWSELVAVFWMGMFALNGFSKLRVWWECVGGFDVDTKYSEYKTYVINNLKGKYRRVHNYVMSYVATPSWLYPTLTKVYEFIIPKKLTRYYQLFRLFCPDYTVFPSWFSSSYRWGVEKVDGTTARFLAFTGCVTFFGYYVSKMVNKRAPNSTERVAIVGAVATAAALMIPDAPEPPPRNALGLEYAGVNNNSMSDSKKYHNMLSGRTIKETISDATSNITKPVSGLWNKFKGKFDTINTKIDEGYILAPLGDLCEDDNAGCSPADARNPFALEASGGKRKKLLWIYDLDKTERREDQKAEDLKHSLLWDPETRQMSSATGTVADMLNSYKRNNLLDVDDEQWNANWEEIGVAQAWARQNGVRLRDSKYMFDRELGRGLEGGMCDDTDLGNCLDAMSATFMCADNYDVTQPLNDLESSMPVAVVQMGRAIKLFKKLAKNSLRKVKDTIAQQRIADGVVALTQSLLPFITNKATMDDRLVLTNVVDSYIDAAELLPRHYSFSSNVVDDMLLGWSKPDTSLESVEAFRILSSNLVTLTHTKATGTSVTTRTVTASVNKNTVSWPGHVDGQTVHHFTWRPTEGVYTIEHQGKTVVVGDVRQTSYDTCTGTIPPNTFDPPMRARPTLPVNVAVEGKDLLYIGVKDGKQIVDVAHYVGMEKGVDPAVGPVLFLKYDVKTEGGDCGNLVICKHNGLWYQVARHMYQKKAVMLSWLESSVGAYSPHQLGGEFATARELAVHSASSKLADIVHGNILTDPNTTALNVKAAKGPCAELHTRPMSAINEGEELTKLLLPLPSVTQHAANIKKQKVKKVSFTVPSGPSLPSVAVATALSDIGVGSTVQNKPPLKGALNGRRLDTLTMAELNKLDRFMDMAVIKSPGSAKSQTQALSVFAAEKMMVKNAIIHLTRSQQRS